MVLCPVRVGSTLLGTLPKIGKHGHFLLEQLDHHLLALLGVKNHLRLIFPIHAGALLWVQGRRQREVVGLRVLGELVCQHHGGDVGRHPVR